MITNRDDDYLICKEYQSRIDQKSTDHPGFITFQHANGNHYFAWVHDGEVVLRSEAYPNEEKMLRGIAAIQKNWDLVERYSVEEAHGVHFLVLWGGGDHQAHSGNMGDHNEIGRSCPKKSREELHHLLLGKGKDFAQKVVAISEESTDAVHAAAGIAAGAVAVADETVNEATSTVSDIAKEVLHTASKIEDKGAAIASSMTSSATSSHTAASSSASTTTSSYNDNGDSGGGMGWMKWLLPLALLGGLWWLTQKGCNKTAADAAEVGTAAAGEVAGAVSDGVDAAAAVVDTMASFTKKLTSGFELKGAAKDGIESQLVGFIEDDTKVVDKTTWFNFDRLLFDTGKSTLQASSQEQLLNTAEILKAFPKVKLKIGGYTDNVGDPKANMKLSQDRANTVMSELVKLGIEKSRLTAEGYGEQHPVGDNTTEEGRQQNRRIALRVSEK